MQSFSERAGGTCGPIQDQVVVLTADMATTGVPLDCALDAPDMLSADQCKVTKAYTCQLQAGSYVSYVGVTEEKDGGASIVGPVTASLFDETGKLTCRSTYDVTLERQ